mmetsp:Transcript_84643/g.258438  ORF Transcript_84643/g.258438 Transcript_84643/m.258438 type:complete len:336 (+) Transcript_84643:1703-2710(+)
MCVKGDSPIKTRMRDLSPSSPCGLSDTSTVVMSDDAKLSSRTQSSMHDNWQFAKAALLSVVSPSDSNTYMMGLKHVLRRWSSFKMLSPTSAAIPKPPALCDIAKDLNLRWEFLSEAPSARQPASRKLFPLTSSVSSWVHAEPSINLAINSQLAWLSAPQPMSARINRRTRPSDSPSPSASCRNDLADKRIPERSNDCMRARLDFKRPDNVPTTRGPKPRQPDKFTPVSACKHGWPRGAPSPVTPTLKNLVTALSVRPGFPFKFNSFTCGNVESRPWLAIGGDWRANKAASRSPSPSIWPSRSRTSDGAPRNFVSLGWRPCFAQPRLYRTSGVHSQ